MAAFAIRLPASLVDECVTRVLDEMRDDCPTATIDLPGDCPGEGLRPSTGHAGSIALDLALTHGGTATVECRCEILGPEGAPVLMVTGGISAGRHVLASDTDPAPGWWQSQAPALSAFRVVAIDWIGADGALDAPIDARDQAAAILAVLDHLGIASLAGFIGSSYGAMVGMHAAVLAPERIRRLLATSAGPDSHPFTSAQRALQRQAIELGERLGDPAAGVALARKMAMCGYRTPEEFDQRFPGGVGVADGRAHVAAEPYLDAHGAKHGRRMSSVAYRRLSESIDLHRIDPATITVPATFVAVDSDRLIPVQAVRRLAEDAPRGRFRLVKSLYGHDAFLKEDEAIAAILQTFLSTSSAQEPAR